MTIERLSELAGEAGFNTPELIEKLQDDLDLIELFETGQLTFKLAGKTVRLGLIVEVDEGETV